MFFPDYTKVINLGKEIMEENFLSCLIMSEDTGSQHDIVGDINLDHFIQVVPGISLQ